MRVSDILQQLLDRLGDHSKDELQALCQIEGKSTKGTRDELIYRLVQPKPAPPKPETWEYQAPPQ